MVRRIPERPAHPERICWGCDLYCAADDMRCGNGKERTQHPIETFGADWMEFVLPGVKSLVGQAREEQCRDAKKQEEPPQRDNSGARSM